MKFIIKDYEDLRKVDHLLPPRAFLNYWRRKEIALLGGGSNVGKSILVNDICAGINNGASFWGETISDVKGHCIVVDLEQSESLFYNRIKDAPDGFFRGITRISVEFDDDDIDLSVERLLPVLVNLLKESKDPAYVFIDNLTDLIGKRSTEKTAVRLINQLKTLTERYSASFLIVVHTVKRNPGKPISLNDISGSKALTASVDSVFAICESMKGDGVCYIKHLKSKMTSRYREVAEVELTDKPYLHFVLRDWTDEAEHLPARRDRARKYDENDIMQVINLHLGGFSTREIQNETSIPKSTVSRIINEYQNL